MISDSSIKLKCHLSYINLISFELHFIYALNSPANQLLWTFTNWTWNSERNKKNYKCVPSNLELQICNVRFYAFWHTIVFPFIFLVPGNESEICRMHKECRAFIWQHKVLLLSFKQQPSTCFYGFLFWNVHYTSSWKY